MNSLLKPHIVLLIFITLFCCNGFCQYPPFFQYEDENGLPSNEVYSLTQDKRGFIWLGCDAGLFKFDGVRYRQYTCKTQKSKSIAGLTISTSGKLWCTNFQSQLFYVENDKLKEIDFPFKHILHLTCDYNGNLLVNHDRGFAVYNEKKKTWKNYPNSTNSSTRAVRINEKNEAAFLTANSVSIYKNNRLTHCSLPINIRSKILLSSEYNMNWWKNEQWLFPMNGNGKIFKCQNSVISEVKSPKLITAIKDKAITNVINVGDGKLWICTYNGVIRYDPGTDKLNTYYPNLAFSDCMVDKEKNYWFSTLQSGLIRVPNLNFSVWNQFENNKLTKLSATSTQIYFSSVNGDIGLLNSSDASPEFIRSGYNASIQSLCYIPEDNTTYFYSVTSLYSIYQRSSKSILNNAPPIKDLIKIHGNYIACTSFGAICYDLNAKEKSSYKLTELWAREARYDSKNHNLWIATNNGLLRFLKKKNKWVLVQTLFRDKQVLSIDFDTQLSQLYAVTFEGKLFSISPKGKAQKLSDFPEACQPVRVHFNNNHLYTATNKGLFIYDLQSNRMQVLNVFSGLVSNNVQDVIVIDKNIWIASGKGLQKIPVNSPHLPNKAIVFLRQGRKNNNQLEYNKAFAIYPEARTYSSNGNFQYAYRINHSGVWTQIPGTIDKIQLQNIPSGPFEIELKAIDFLDRDSENTILMRGYSHPPFWKTWWFISLEIALFLLIVLLTYRRQLAKRQRELNYQNELNELKLTAIKSQMNPHFIFNVLSSIKGYIYENDRKKATSYLDDFSDLMRSVLEMSEVHFTSLAEEVKLLQLYAELEGMMLEDFEFRIEIDPTLHAETISIPSLVLQPYVENAFKHGLRHKKGKKTLVISIFPINERQLRIELIDNGIGRNAAEELNSSNPIKRQSFATKALEKRIHLINNEEQSIQLEIVDLYDETQAALGTKIQLTLTKTR